MKNLLIVFIFFQLISHSSAKQEKEYKFNWYPVIDIKENVIFQNWIGQNLCKCYSQDRMTEAQCSR